MNFLLKLYATVSNITKAASKIVCLQIKPSGTVLQFADALRSNGVRCGNAHPEEHTEKLFIDGFLVNVHSAVKLL